jgi:hypothetical protein
MAHRSRSSCRSFRFLFSHQELRFSSPERRNAPNRRFRRRTAPTGADSPDFGIFSWRRLALSGLIDVGARAGYSETGVEGFGAALSALLSAGSRIP